MPLKRDTYIVYLNPLDDGEPTEHKVTITHQDMMRGEQAHLGGGATYDAALGLTTSWCWAAMMRTGQWAGTYVMFRDTACAGLEEGPEEAVDPTLQVTTDAPP
jgi:hypothetical protein